jgi:hypothetical protein
MTLTAVDLAGVPGPDTVAASGEARLDMRQRRIVDDAIALLSNSNIMCAFEYLRTRDVGNHVIERVLLDPLQRRAAA